ncbi:MAG: alkaline phosphatase family protein, partial [Candidatus Hydrogenedentales bacterium]
MNACRIALLALCCCLFVHTAIAAEAPPSQILVIVLDGLRPDYVTPELMPNLHALGERGVVCEDHHSVFPTVTRVNASSIATGCYPAKHGLMGNSVYFPEVNAASGLSTGDAKNLMKIDEATNGQLLTAPSLGELLQAQGKKLLAVSSGSSGSSFLLNRKAAGGGVINVEQILPVEQAQSVKDSIGEVPKEAEPNREQNRWAVDAYLKYGLEVVHPDVTIMWISDPDHTAHGAGIGSPECLATLKNNDEEIGRILASLEQQGLSDRVDIIVASDHGFSTHKGKSNVSNLLVERGLKESAKSTDVIVVEGAIYVRNHDKAKIRAIVAALQEAEWIGPVFTLGIEPDALMGSVAGTFSFGLAHWSHARSADILIGANWSDEANEYGWKGTTSLTGTAGHGTSSPFDIHNTLIVAGPAFKKGIRSRVPTGNVDIAPTVLRLAGLEPAPSMDGRVLDELLASGPDPAKVSYSMRDYTVEANLATGVYRCVLSTSMVSE